MAKTHTFGTTITDFDVMETANPQSSEHTRLLHPKEVARRLNVSPRTLETWRYRGEGPHYIQISARCIRYREADIEAWLSDRQRASTSACAALQ